MVHPNALSGYMIACFTDKDDDWRSFTQLLRPGIYQAVLGTQKTKGWFDDFSEISGS